MTRRITRREAVLEAMLGAGALAGCGAGPAPSSGSTLRSTWIDPLGNGQLVIGPGEPLVDRVELGPQASAIGVLATLAHLTDAHVLDASSPARVPFLDRLGPPFQSTFRPQEALTVQVLAGAVAAVARLRPRLVIQGGDLIDNDQSNELSQALTALAGGRVRPGSGPRGYYGVQSGLDPDPFYYRPEVDAPRYPGLLRRAVRPFRTPGLGAPAFPVLGDHDVLVAGEIVPTPLTRALAIGDRALWDLPTGLTVPRSELPHAGASPDGPPQPGPINDFLHRALEGPTVSVPPDPARREMELPEVVARLARAVLGATPALATGERLDYAVDAGSRVRLIVLDLVRRGGGSGGLVSADQPAWLERQLAAAGDRWVIAVSHQPLASSVGGELLLELLDRHPRVIAALSGHVHHNRIVPRPSPAGGYWLITTSSLIDHPQQARALRVLATAAGGVAIQTWMLDHAFPGPLGAISRELAYVDAQGGRPTDARGTHLDRNVTLYRAAPRVT
jgi:3',5'-cyclic AMP phosphodiesterase CpdA